MTFSKKRYFEQLFKTLIALHQKNYANHFINNPGFGSIFNILDDDNYREEFTKILNENFGEDYSEQIIGSLKNASLTSYFTPIDIVDAISKTIIDIKDFKPKSFLEPSAGNGIIIKSIIKTFPEIHTTAFEKDILTSRILEHNTKNIKNKKIYGIPFEAITNTDARKKFDLIVTNVPFGEVKVFDSTISKHPLSYLIRKTIHGYFIHKSLSLLTSNGVAALIVTKSFLDKNRYTELRKNIIEGNIFLGAIRLPNSTFQAENTRVVSDLLFFQNNNNLIISETQKRLNTLFTQTITKEIKGNEVEFNQYFEEYPKHIFGTLEKGGLYDNKDYTVNSNATTLQIGEFIIDTLNINANFSKKVDINIPTKINFKIEKNREDSIDLTNYQVGNLIIYKQKVAKVTGLNAFEFLKISAEEFDKISKVIPLRDNYLKLLEAKSKAQYNQLQKSLNASYDLFNFQYGNLNDKRNRHLIGIDIQGPLILSLEKLENKMYVKADILLKEYIALDTKETTIKAENIEDAILISLNKKAKLDVPLISDILNKNLDHVIKEGLEKDLFFFNPVNGTIEISTKDEFYSGEIIDKISFYKQNKFDEYQKFITEDYLEDKIFNLNKIAPTITPYSDLGVRLYESWFDIEITEKFIKDTYNSEAKIQYNNSINKFISKVNGVDITYTKKFQVNTNTRYYTFKHILNFALNETIPYTTKGEDKNKRIDRDKMEEIRLKTELFYKDFDSYVNENPEIKRRIEHQFYKKFESHLKANYSGDFLSFSRLKNFTPYPYQKDAVYSTIKNNGLLVNMAIGYGKTLTMILSAMKMKELGISKKTLIIGLDSTITQLDQNFRLAFPEIKLLTASKQNAGSKLKREQFFAQAANNDYDVVLMSHDTFKFIPQSLEIQRDIISDELNNLTLDLKALYKNKRDINKRTLKGLEIRKENLVTDLKYIYNEIEHRKDNTVDFESMGIDHIMVDESQHFKNLMYTTRHHRVAGLNTSKGSQKSKNLLTAIRTLQKKKNSDFQASFFSGTPISNSIIETYTIFKYLIPKKLKELNIFSFDQWAKVFAEKNYEYEPMLNGSYKVKERFRKFKKLKQLSKLYSSISILVNNDTHPKDIPKMNPLVYQIDQTPEQKIYANSIQQFLKTGDLTNLHSNKTYNDPKKIPVALIALHHLRYNSADPRLINPNLPDEANNKLRTIAKQVYNKYKITNHFKGTQAIFSDIGTPKKEFNLYSELKRILVEDYNLPDDEIDFIHNFPTHEKKQVLFNKFNNGDIRIILGSTQKLGTGNNIQKRLIHIAHIDLPYRSTDLDQRNGRGPREGNIFAKSHYDNKVDISFYLVKGSSDAVFLNHINTKNNFIKQLNNGTIQFNELDLGPIDDNGNMDYKSMIALSHNNPLFLEKEELKSKIDKLELEKNIFKSNQSRAANENTYYQKAIDRNTTTLGKLKKDDITYSSIINSKEYYSKIKLHSKTPIFNHPSKIGNWLIGAINNVSKKPNKTTIATFIDAELIVKPFIHNEGYELIVNTENFSYSYGSKKAVENPNTVADYIKNSLLKIKGLTSTYTKNIEYDSKCIKANNNIINVTFDKDDELTGLKKQMDEINVKLDDIEKQVFNDKEEKSEAKTTVSNDISL